jgi:hypothetical protein
VVLGGEDVAGSPGDLSTEVSEGLDEDSGLDGCIIVSKKANVVCKTDHILM